MKIARMIRSCNSILEVDACEVGYLCFRNIRSANLATPKAPAMMSKMRDPKTNIFRSRRGKMPSYTLRLCVSAAHFLHPIVPVLQRPLHLHQMPLAFVAVFFSQLSRQRLKQSESNIHRLKILRFDVRDIAAQGPDRRGRWGRR